MLVSCVFYSFEALPELAREILWFNPIIHVVGMLRHGIYLVYDPAHVSAGYVIVFSLILMTTGLFGMRATRARLLTA